MSNHVHPPVIKGREVLDSYKHWYQPEISPLHIGLQRFASDDSCILWLLAPSASGKSTLAQNLSRDGFRVFDLDYFGNHITDPTTTQNRPTFWQLNISLIKAMLRSGDIIAGICDNRKELLTCLEELGFTVIICCPLPPLSTYMQGLVDRANSTHNGLFKRAWSPASLITVTPNEVASNFYGYYGRIPYDSGATTRSDSFALPAASNFTIMSSRDIKYGPLDGVKSVDLYVDSKCQAWYVNLSETDTFQIPETISNVLLDPFGGYVATEMLVLQYLVVNKVKLLLTHREYYSASASLILSALSAGVKVCTNHDSIVLRVHPVSMAKGIRFSKSSSDVSSVASEWLNHTLLKKGGYLHIKTTTWDDSAIPRLLSHFPSRLNHSEVLEYDKVRLAAKLYYDEHAGDMSGFISLSPETRQLMIDKFIDTYFGDDKFARQLHS